MNNDIKESTIELAPNRKELLIGLSTSMILLLLAFSIGTLANGWGATTSVVLPGMIFEVFVAALASIAFGFDPLSGALISAISNIVLAPFLLVTFELLIHKSPWLNKKMARAEKIGKKYGKFGVFILAPLAPFVGVFVCIAVGAVLRFRSLYTLLSISTGIVLAAFFTTYGGDEIMSLLF